MPSLRLGYDSCHWHFRDIYATLPFHFYAASSHHTIIEEGVYRLVMTERHAARLRIDILHIHVNIFDITLRDIHDAATAAISQTDREMK